MLRSVVRYYHRLRERSQLSDSQWTAVIVLALSAAASLAMGYVLHRLNQTLATASGEDILSLALAFNGHIANEIIQRWHAAGVIKSALQSLWLDFPFIAAYTGFMVSAVYLAKAHLQRLAVSSKLFMVFAGLPLVAALLDIIENTLLLYGLHTATGPHMMSAYFAGLLALFKFIALAVFILLAMLLARPVFKVLALVRFSLLMLAVGIALLFVPQWLEVLRAVTESETLAPTFLTALASLLAATSTWYSARVIYTFDWRDYAPELKRMKKWLPRVAGFLMPILVLFGYLNSGSDTYVVAASIQFLAAVVFLLIVVNRRAMMSNLVNPLLASTQLNLAIDAEPESDKVKGWQELSPTTRWALLILLLLNALVTAYFGSSSARAEVIGTAPLLLLAVSLIVPVGSLLVFLGTRYVMLEYNGNTWRVPVLTTLFLIIALFSFTNDNHHVRLCAGASSTDGICPDQMTDSTGKHRIDEDATDLVNDDAERNDGDSATNTYLTHWLKTHPLYQASGDTPHEVPAIIVSTEGGGIRAAYWTAHVLGVLQDRLASTHSLDFSRNVLAISGVSGGSLGGAAFVASVATARQQSLDDSPTAQSTSETVHKTTQPHAFNFTRIAHDFLKQDFLAPTAASLMFPDLAQRFLPLPVFNDRAIALEESWERAWANACAEGNHDAEAHAPCSELFRLAYDRLWPANKTPHAPVPALLMNSTVVASGKRLIMTPPPLETAFHSIFHDAVNGRDIVGDQIALSTAVHLSARFTYVSPAGTAHYNYSTEENQAKRHWLRLVDGGYFENSGTVTAGELLAAVERYNRNSASAPKIKPFVIHISNDPIKRGTASAPPHGEPKRFLGELLPPLNALLNVRPARGYQARQAIQRQAMASDDGDYRFVHFRLCDGDIPLPLGWTLSDKARCSIESQFPATRGQHTTGPCSPDAQADGKNHFINQARAYNDANFSRIEQFFGIQRRSPDVTDTPSPETLENDLIRACSK